MSPKKMIVAATFAYVGMLTTVTVTAKQTTNTRTKNVKTVNYVKQRIQKHINDPYIAEVISKAKRPYLIAAIKLVESGQSGPYIMGDGGDSHGMFQINKKIHGDFDMSVESQTRKCESIIYNLVERYGIQDGIRRYNGSGPMARNYSKKVLKIISQIENS